jgi:hypothetical protein
MLEGKLNESVFERLMKKKYNLSNTQPEEDSVVESSMEMPPISLHRGAPIHVALYELQ